MKNIEFSRSCLFAIYLPSVNKENKKTMCEICLKLTVKVAVIGSLQVSVMLICNIFHALFWCFRC